MFGAGWSIPYEVEMEISPQPDGSCTAVYINEQGRRIEIEALQPGEGIRIVSENINIHCGEQNRWIIEDDDGTYRLFEPDPNQPNRLYLTVLQDRNDNHLFIYRDQHSRISHISADDSKAATISLHYQDKRHPQRVTHIKRELADGSSQLLSQYHYNAQGDLQQIIDAENRPTREFAYDNGRRMIYHRLPTGLQCHYQWDSFSGSDGIEWRVIRHWSEADGKRLEDYRFQYDLSKHLTTAYDSLGRVSQHYWNEVYQLTRYIDVLGQTTEFEWNEDQQLISVTDPQGGKWHYSYDEQGRQTEETDPPRPYQPDPVAAALGFAHHQRRPRWQHLALLLRPARQPAQRYRPPQTAYPVPVRPAWTNRRNHRCPRWQKVPALEPERPTDSA
ncbi:hypothetical protein BHC59_00365 [Snodgrassella alvi]|nr:hypothetical protein BHC59_00365 [Snodgrassella alvi]